MSREGSPGSLTASILAVRELAGQRGVLDLREAERGVRALAAELEELLDAARSGSSRSREAALAVASWLAHREAAGDALEPLRAAVDEAGLPLASAILARSDATAALAPHGRLAEVGLPARASFAVPHDDTPSGRLVWYASFGSRRRERFRMHHDAVMIGRLLDASWCRLADVLVVASRRPTTPEIVLALATRDRWFGRARVREAIGANPFSPASLVLALLPSMSAATLRVLARGRPSPIQRAAKLFRSGE